MNRRTLADVMRRAHINSPAAVRCSLQFVQELLEAAAAESYGMYDRSLYASMAAQMEELRHDVLRLLPAEGELE